MELINQMFFKAAIW